MMRAGGLARSHPHAPKACVFVVAQHSGTVFHTVFESSGSPETLPEALNILEDSEHHTGGGHVPYATLVGHLIQED